MSKEQTGKKTKRKVPKVRSYVRPTRVHTPKPKKKPKYPGKEVEDGLGDLLNNCTLHSLLGDPFAGFS